jgi:DNA-binding SARP family transcriptional activator/class 3 adenylate cyclase
MQFRILGPLEVHSEAGAVALGGDKRRALLALLVLHANKPVSAERLAMALWGEEAPLEAVKTVRVHVSRTRAALGDPDALVTTPAGYRLRVRDGELDADRFEDLLEQGRSALGRGAHERAAALLREALGLWRGPVLPDVRYEGFAQAEIARLEELRWDAIEALNDADLELGRIEGVLAEHEGAPLRERLIEQRMRALYRAGRHVEALATYREARRRLDEELGLEPGLGLRQLEQAILAHDPALEPPAAPPAAPAGPERKLATVVVIELVVDGDVDSERHAARLEAALGAVADAMRELGGEIERGIGGTLLATFGAPVAHEDHADRALRAALAARDRVEPAVAVRIGVESGELLAHGGAVAGAPVGVAAKLAATAPDRAVIVGERVAAAVRGSFVIEDGRLVGAVAAPRRRGGAGRAFVGRRDELALLEATWDRVVGAERPHLATIVGDAGIGKTSLLAVLGERLGPGVRWYTGRCLAYGRAIAYRPLAEIARQRLGLHGAEHAEEIRAQLGELAPLLGVDADPDVHPWEARERLRAAWIELLGRLAADGPAVVWVEDLHWADDALLDLLEQGVREVAGPLLVAATARPELLGRRPGWGAGTSDGSRLHLEPLRSEEAAAMLDRLAPGLPQDIAAQVLGRAEGNPFFVEEVLASLLERGALRRTDTGWATAGMADGLALSDTVQGVIAARIDMLPPADKAALQAAAVVGRTFWEGAVRELAGTPAGGLGLLVERDFARRVAGSALPGERELAFKHALTREVAYASLPIAARARMHAGFAAWLERAGGGRDEDAPLLAHHYGEAMTPAHADLAWADEPERVRDLRAKAVAWMRRAAELAMGRYAIDDALTLLAAARELEPDAAGRAALWHATAGVHRLSYKIDDFRRAIEQAVALAPDAPLTARAYADLALAGSQPYIWRNPPGDDVVARWIAAALERAGADDVARARALASRAQAAPAHGKADADEALRLAERVGDPTLHAHAIDAQLLVARTQDRLHDAAEWSARGVALAQAVPDRHQRSGMLLYAAFAHLWVGQIRTARRLATEHDALATPLSAHHRVHAVAAHLLVHAAGGDWHAARALAERTEAASRANADTPCQFNWRTLLILALSHAVLGDDREARRLEQLASGALTVGGLLPREPAVLRLAMVRCDRVATEALLAADPGPDLWDVDYRAARLDALAWIGDRDGVEAEAERALALGGYVEPFALRALAAVRRSDELRAEAAAHFAAMGLPPDGPPGLLPAGP